MSLGDRALERYLWELQRRARELGPYLEQLRGRGDGMVRRATARSWELLPATIRWPGPRQVVLVPLGCDARVDGPTVYFDSSLAWVAGTFGITSLLAHEFHHVGRVARAGGDLSSLRPGNLSRRLAEWGPARFWATLVELEGFADCVFPPTGLGLPHQARQAPAPGSR